MPALTPLLHPQAHALLLRGRPPPPDDTLRALAALRLQSLHRDFSPRAPLPRLDRLLPPSAPPREDSPRPVPRPAPSAALLAGAIWSPGLAKRQAERARRGGAGRTAGSPAREGGGGAGTAAAVLGGWKRLRGMGRAEAMAAYLALAAQCPGFGAARYDVLELSTVRGRRERGLWWPKPHTFATEPQAPSEGHFTAYTQHRCPSQTPKVTGPWALPLWSLSPLHTCTVDHSGDPETPRSRPSPPDQKQCCRVPSLHPDSAYLWAGAWWGRSTEAMPGPGCQGHVLLATG